MRIAAIVLTTVAWAATVCRTPAASAAAHTLAVSAGKHNRAHVPMSVPLPGQAAGAKMTDTGKEVPCQVAEGRLWWVLDALPAGQTKTYTVELGPAQAAAAGGVELKQDQDKIEVSIDGLPFTTYRFSNPKIGPNQLRRPCFWPVLGPDQTPMTRPYPLTDDLAANVTKDHPHHTSIWVAYGEINNVDNWSNSDKAGWQVHRKFEAVSGGPVMGVIRQLLDWTDAAKTPIAAEVRTVRLWRTPQAARMMDFEIVIKAAYGKVHLGDTKEGGMISTRMRDELKADKGGQEGRLVNSEGQSGAEAWGKPARWCDASGIVDGKRVGYAVMDHPANLRHPTPWHARTYGLLTANPFGLSSFNKAAPKGDYTIDEGKELVLRYRLYFHAGDEKQAQVDDRWADYADPPAAVWK